MEACQEGRVLGAGSAVELTAQSERAVLYGLRTIMEALDNGGLHYDWIVDWPDTGERGFRLDAARKFYTRGRIMDCVRGLSNRMNAM